VRRRERHDVSIGCQAAAIYRPFRGVAPRTFAPDANEIKTIFDKRILRVNVQKPAELVIKKVAIPVRRAS